MQVMEVNHRAIDHEIMVLVVVVDELVLINEDQLQDEKNPVTVHHVVVAVPYMHLKGENFYIESLIQRILVSILGV
jgi:hypothetical protein